MKKSNYEHPVANLLILAPDDLLCTSVGWDAANKEDVVSAKEGWFTNKCPPGQRTPPHPAGCGGH